MRTKFFCSIFHFMTLYEFNSMDEAEQQEALWEHSVKLAEREDADFRYRLFQIDRFYIERRYDKECNVCKGQRTFQNPNEYLDPYLGQIDLKL